MNERNNQILNFNKKLTRTSQKNPRSMFYLSKVKRQILSNFNQNWRRSRFWWNCFITTIKLVQLTQTFLLLLIHPQLPAASVSHFPPGRNWIFMIDIFLCNLTFEYIYVGNREAESKENFAIFQFPFIAHFGWILLHSSLPYSTLQLSAVAIWNASDVVDLFEMEKRSFYIWVNQC